MTLKNFDEAIARAQGGGPRRLAVVCAEDDLVLQGVSEAVELGLVEPLLFGDREAIHARLDALGLPHWETVHVEGSPKDVSFRGIDAIRAGDADLIMKGQMSTSALFSAVLNHERGLRTDRALSHIAFVEIPTYPKLFGFTDGGLNVRPDFDKKVQIVSNAIHAFHRFGYERPKIGLLAYVEKVRKGDPETEDWAKITEMAKNGAFAEAAVEGPLAADLCLSREAAEIKHIKSEVAGDVDVIVAPDITVCNACTKCMVLAGGTAAGVMVGAKTPIVALSRTDTPRIRVSSIAMAICLMEKEG